MIDEYIEERLEKLVEAKISKTLEPLVMLKEFDNVEQLTIDEVCKIFRRDADDKSKQWIREACKRGEIPCVKVGDSYLFPKRQMVMLLLGEWKPEKENKKKKFSNLRDVAREFVG